MKKSNPSWAITGLWSLAAAGTVAFVNLVLCRNYGGVVQPDLVMALHIATAFLGAGSLARFVQGSRRVMDEPAPGAVWGTTYIARVGEFSQRVRGKSAFFSTKRTAQLLGFLLCLMSQFVFVAAPVQPDAGAPVSRTLPT